MVAGRFPSDWPRVSHTAIVNEAFRNRYFDGTNPIGQAITVHAAAARLKSSASSRMRATCRCAIGSADGVMPLMAADEPWIEIGIRPRSTISSSGSGLSTRYRDLRQAPASSSAPSTKVCVTPHHASG